MSQDHGPRRDGNGVCGQILRRMQNLAIQSLQQAQQQAGEGIEVGQEATETPAPRRRVSLSGRIQALAERDRRLQQRQAGAFKPQCPQEIRGWVRGHPTLHREFGGVDPQEYQKYTTDPYQWFPKYDTVSPNLRNLAPVDKPMSDEDAKRLEDAFQVRFGNKIGAGAIGAVWEAELWGRRCVVKRLAAADFSDRNWPTRAGSRIMVEEMRAMHRLCKTEPKHGNIIGCDFIWRVYQEDTSFPDPISVLMFLERCDSDLDHIIESQIPNNITLNEDDCRKLCVTMFHALDYCHSRGIAHLDIKPENIMIIRESPGSKRAKFILADFGLAQTYPVNLDDNGQVIPGQYPMEVDLFGGTEFFAPQEFINVKTLGHPIDSRRCDIWSMGITGMIAMVGWAPYTGQQNQRPGYGSGDNFLKVKNLVLTAAYNILPNQIRDHINTHFHINEETFNFFRFVLNENRHRRPLANDVLGQQWAQQWQYDGGFVQLDFLP